VTTPLEQTRWHFTADDLTDGQILWNGEGQMCWAEEVGGKEAGGDMGGRCCMLWLAYARREAAENQLSCILLPACRAQKRASLLAMTRAALSASGGSTFSIVLPQTDRMPHALAIFSVSLPTRACYQATCAGALSQCHRGANAGGEQARAQRISIIAALTRALRHL